MKKWKSMIPWAGMMLIMYLAIFFMSAESLFADNATFSSMYTPIDKCKVLERDTEELYYFKEKCPGRDGYTVFKEGADDRSWLVLQKGSSKINLQPASFKGPVHFVNISGKVLEWRYLIEGKKKSLRALIYRITGVEPDDPMKIRSLLYVLRLEAKKWCILGTASTNKEARQLADSKQTCP